MSSDTNETLPTLPSDICVVLIDFDETLTKEHTGGALQFRRCSSSAQRQSANGTLLMQRIDLHRDCANSGDVSLTSNAASGDLAWTFRMLADIVLRQRRCLAIVTMADAAHGPMRAAQTNLDPLQYDTLAGAPLVRRWLLCAALVLYNNEYDRARSALDELDASGRFVIVAQAHPSSKETHVRAACQHFFDAQQLDAGQLQARHMLYIDNTECLLRSTAKCFPGMRTVHTPAGVDRDVWQHICATACLQ